MFKSLLRPNALRSARFYSPLPRSARPAYRAVNKRVVLNKPEDPQVAYYNQESIYDVSNPNGLIGQHDGITRMLSEPTLVIERQVEMMNVFLGFEQANKYVIMDSLGNRLGHMQERDLSFFKIIMRQVYRLHRPFVVDVFDNEGNVLMTIKRPFSFINSHIKSILPGFNREEDGIIGETIQSWHLWRRRYNLYKSQGEENYDQFGAVDAPFLSFEFPVTDENGVIIGAVDRNWVGLGRELFTDSGVYIVRMDPASFAGLGGVYETVGGPMTLDQRAVLLANAVSIDFDYFSRHSNHRGGLLSFGGSYE